MSGEGVAVYPIGCYRGFCALMRTTIAASPMKSSRKSCQVSVVVRAAFSISCISSIPSSVKAVRFRLGRRRMGALDRRDYLGRVKGEGARACIVLRKAHLGPKTTPGSHT